MDEFDYPELYDAANKWSIDDDFYLELAQRVGGPVLDLGCGTGRLAGAIAERGIEIVGLDRSQPMLAQARRRPTRRSLHWVLGDVRAFAFRRRFSLIIMTSHVWQFLLTDDDQRDCLSRVREHLTADGLFAFESRQQPLDAAARIRYSRRFKDKSRRLWSMRYASGFDAETSIDSGALTYLELESGSK